MVNDRNQGSDIERGGQSSGDEGGRDWNQSQQGQGGYGQGQGHPHDHNYSKFDDWRKQRQSAGQPSPNNGSSGSSKQASAKSGSN